MPHGGSVDLEQPTTVGRVVVVGYYGDNRHYGFTVEGSLDGKTWDMLADRRDNTEPSTKDGYTCEFKPVEVRYLRVTIDRQLRQHRPPSRRSDGFREMNSSGENSLDRFAGNSGEPRVQSLEFHGHPRMLNAE